MGPVKSEEISVMSAKQLKTHRQKKIKAQKMCASSEFLQAMAKKFPLHPQYIMECLGLYRTE